MPAPKPKLVGVYVLIRLAGGFLARLGLGSIVGCLLGSTLSNPLDVGPEVVFLGLLAGTMYATPGVFYDHYHLTGKTGARPACPAYRPGGRSTSPWSC